MKVTILIGSLKVNGEVIPKGESVDIADKDEALKLIERKTVEKYGVPNPSDTEKINSKDKAEKEAAQKAAQKVKEKKEAEAVEKAEVIADISRIKGVTPVIAETLFTSELKDIDAIANSTIKSLTKLDIAKTIAKVIIKSATEDFE